MSGSVVEIKIDYADLFEYSLDFLFILDLKGNIIDINNVATETLGYSRREILNMNIAEFLLEEEIEQLLNKRKELINIGRISQYHIYCIRKKDGELLYLETHGIPLREEGEIHSILGIGHEITEVKNAEKLLQTSEIKYRSLFNQSPYSIFIFDNKGNLQDSNRNLINKLAEYADEDFTGKNFIEIIKYFKNSKQLLQLFSERFKALREGDILDSIEFPLITKEGMKIWLYWESSIMRINGDKFIQVIIQDITEKKESEERFHVLFNNSTSGIAYHRVIYDLQNNPVDYVITDVNTQFEAIVPLKREEVINKRATEVYQVENAPYLDIYSKVAASQESTEFEAFFPPMNAYFKISVISPKKGEFITVFDDITSQKESEQKLKESEEKFRTLFEKANDGILLSDAETWQIFTGNQKICQMLGYSLEEIKKFSLADLHPKETLSSIDDQFMHKEQEDISIANDVPMKRKDGSVFYCNVNSSEIELSGRKYIMGIFRDISNRRQAEQKLSESEEKFRTITEQSLLGIIIIQDGIFKYVNDIVSEMIGYDKQEIMNWSPNDFFNKIHHNDVPIALRRFQQKQSGEMDVFLSYPYRIYTKSNEVKWIDVYSKIITFQGENAILASIADVTEKKEAEQKLQESEEKYRWISENTDDLIVVYDEKLNVEYSNEETHVRMLGYPIHKLNNLDFRTSLIHRDDLKQTSEAFKEGFQKGKFKHQLRIKHKDLRELWFETKGRVLVNKNGKKNLLAVSRDITEIKKSEEKLRESEEKFRSIAEQSLMGIFILQDDVYKYVNKKYADMIGYPIEELLNWPPMKYLKNIHPNYLEKAMQIEEQVKLDTFETIDRLQFQAVKKSGELFWSEVYAKNINYEGKKARLFNLVDITYQKEAEEKLKESEEKFRTITEQSLVGIIILQDDIIKYANQRVVDILGYPTEEFKTWDPGEFIKVFHTDSRQILIEQAEKKQRGANDVLNHYIAKFLKNTGATIWLEVFSRSIPYEGRPADFITFIDINERKKAEQELKESEEKFRTIAEQSFMGIVIVQEGKLKYLNKALAKMLEYPFEEIIKWSDKEMAEIVHPDDIEYIIKKLQSNREGTMSQISQNYFRIITKSGEIRWLEDYTSKIIYQGKVANLMSVVDVSNKKEAERLIIEENERLLELNELRKDLITRVSHELKTPMTSIYGSIQILLTIYNKDLSEEVLNYVKIGHRGCLRLKQLIENLLDASRLESKKFELSLLKENLVEIIVDCVEDLNYLVHNRHLLITLDLPDEIQADIDSLRFRQVITNIISNAIKNTPKEGEIFIHIIEDDDKIDILIRDTGVGLTKQEQEKLFEKFGKIERYGMDLDVDIEGCGLGLYISKEIIELHKGQILVESEGRNKGSTFTIRLFK